ncbi:hypothetical protein JX265_009157 [Neoarthrinium moseri]|uniref:Uncharacterized protein n=1 Tax=Neoarthrinium moseri TaxID=1658444 RepID=A0A9Q0ALG4_9PEZI|nr:hypothetical protein JX265_009157 [Neoarthrinium moseri]
MNSQSDTQPFTIPYSGSIAVKEGDAWIPSSMVAGAGMAASREYSCPPTRPNSPTLSSNAGGVRPTWHIKPPASSQLRAIPSDYDNPMNRPVFDRSLGNITREEINERLESLSSARKHTADAQVLQKIEKIMLDWKQVLELRGIRHDLQKKVYFDATGKNLYMSGDVASQIEQGSEAMERVRTIKVMATLEIEKGLPAPIIEMLKPRLKWHSTAVTTPRPHKKDDFVVVRTSGDEPSIGMEPVEDDFVNLTFCDVHNST